MMRRLIPGVLGALLAGGFYLLLVDNVQVPERYAVVAVAFFAGLAFMASREQGGPEAAVSPGWLLRAWRALASVPQHVAFVIAEALAQLISPRHARGRFRAVPFRGGASPADVGRRALTESVGSFAPNTIVIGVDPERELLLVHQLHRHGSREELDVLRLG
jgi:hypothetical protein